MRAAEAARPRSAPLPPCGHRVGSVRQHLVAEESDAREATAVQERVSRLVLRVEWGTRETAADLVALDKRPAPLRLRPKSASGGGGTVSRYVSAAPPAYLPAALPRAEVCPDGGKDSGGVTLSRRQLARPPFATHAPGRLGGTPDDLARPLAAARFLTRVPCCTLERAAKAQQLVHVLRGGDPFVPAARPGTAWSRYRFAPAWAETLPAPAPMHSPRWRMALWKRHGVLWNAISDMGAVESDEARVRDALTEAAATGCRVAAAITIQKMQRGRAAREAALLRCAAILVVQCSFRCALARRRCEARSRAKQQEQLEAAARLLLRRTGRAATARRRLGLEWAAATAAERLRRAACAVQRTGRGGLERRMLAVTAEQLGAACTMQRCVRCWLARRRRRRRRLELALREDAGWRFALFVTDLRRLESAERASIIGDCQCSQHRLRQLAALGARLALRGSMLEQLPLGGGISASRAAVACSADRARCATAAAEESAACELFCAAYRWRWLSRTMPEESERRQLAEDYPAAAAEALAAAGPPAAPTADSSASASPAALHEAPSPVPPPAATPRAAPPQVALLREVAACGGEQRPALAPAEPADEDGEGEQPAGAAAEGPSGLRELHQEAVRGARADELQAAAQWEADRAALTIQAATRGWMARRRVQRLRARRNGAAVLRAHAATIIQSLARGVVSRRRTAARRPLLQERRLRLYRRRRAQRRYRAARTLQRWWRRVSELRWRQIHTHRVALLTRRGLRSAEGRRRTELREEEEVARRALRSLAPQPPPREPAAVPTPESETGWVECAPLAELAGAERVERRREVDCERWGRERLLAARSLLAP
eukprot:TRINITY_DN6510_c0_g1_i1.p1 TRINITY_DN6510_c0_g1~~TRINITY_DN6510_c0_g1_i1.p1  ORF type:complete len:861 (+),score=199.62 TRINITY_DN6510_c0_g1_i1:72-2585(+)